jgi:hypothetical protein
MTRRDLAVIAGASFGSGFLLYYAFDRIAFLTGHTFRDVRYAGRVT